MAHQHITENSIIITKPENLVLIVARNAPVEVVVDLEGIGRQD